MDRKKISQANRIVIKFGTNILTNDEGEVSLPRIYSFIEDISNLKKTAKKLF